MKLIRQFFKKLFYLLFDVHEEDINEIQDENNNSIDDNNDYTEEESENHELSEEELEQEDFNYYDGNKEINLLKKNCLI